MTDDDSILDSSSDNEVNQSEGGDDAQVQGSNKSKAIHKSLHDISLHTFLFLVYKL